MQMDRPFAPAAQGTQPYSSPIRCGIRCFLLPSARIHGASSVKRQGADGLGQLVAKAQQGREVDRHVKHVPYHAGRCGKGPAAPVDGSRFGTGVDQEKLEPRSDTGKARAVSARPSAQTQNADEVVGREKELVPFKQGRVL